MPPVVAARRRGADARFKVDLLLVVAHPDDDVLAGTYFAKLLDEGKRIAVVFMTSGESGGNAAGVERATSLGLIRQTEARNDLSSIGSRALAPIAGSSAKNWPKPARTTVFCVN